jgi:hypothetical protein
VLDTRANIRECGFDHGVWWQLGVVPLDGPWVLGLVADLLWHSTLFLPTSEVQVRHTHTSYPHPGIGPGAYVYTYGNRCDTPPSAPHPGTVR